MQYNRQSVQATRQHIFAWGRHLLFRCPALTCNQEMLSTLLDRGLALRSWRVAGAGAEVILLVRMR